jgi:hypothetical protein
MSGTPDDPYAKLRPPTPTPPEELCSCTEPQAILLRFAFTANPIACTTCNREVCPEVLGLTRELAEHVAYWRAFFEAFYFLWLDSREFESWASAELSNPSSPVNLRGLELRARLEAVRRCYYWWFQDVGADDFIPVTSCPICGLQLTPFDSWLVCEPCSVLVAN